MCSKCFFIFKMQIVQPYMIAPIRQKSKFGLKVIQRKIKTCSFCCFFKLRENKCKESTDQGILHVLTKFALLASSSYNIYTN